MTGTVLFALIWVVAALVLGVLVLWLVVLGVEWFHVFRPSHDVVACPSDAGLAYEDVEFMTEDGKRLHGWWIPAEGAPGTLLYCHGNAGNVGTRVETLQALSRMGLHLLVFDYRGYGKSRGTPSERGMRMDARAAYEVVRSRYGDDENPPVVVYGRSLGGAVALRLALDRPVRGVAAEATFSSMLDLAAHLYPLLPYRWLGRYRFDTARAAAAVRAPKLIAHSTDDKLIPMAMGRSLFEAACEPKQFVTLRGDHGEPGWVSNPDYFEVLREFMHRALNPQT